MHSDNSGSNEFEYDPLSKTRIDGPVGGSIGTAPDQISVYRLAAEIGRGGMGVVYLAMDSTLQRLVALKLLLHSAQIDVTSVKRFHNEALAAAKLSHPNIVHVHNVGEDKGIHFIAMQFIDGSNLLQIMKRIRAQVSEQHPVAGSTKPKEQDQTSPLTPGESGETSAKSDHESGVEWSAKDFTVQRSGNQLRVGRRVINGVAKLGVDVAEALQHAHDMGIIHRDIKPSNLMLDKTGRIWVSDFGLAHISTSPGLTRTGAVLGTYRYMSPEQAAGNHNFLDHRSDVYSLGATLFEMIALRPAIDVQGSEQILRAIAYGPTPSLMKSCRDVPADLSLILETAMAKNPSDRYATAGEMAEDLRRFLNGQPVKASPLPAWKRVRYWISRHQKLAVGAVAGLFCALLTSTASAFLLLGALNRETQALHEKQVALKESEGLRALANAGLQLEKSPGLSLALAMNADGSPLLEQRQAIQEAWDRCHEYAIYEYPAGVASMVRCSRDGSRVVTCTYLGQTSDRGPSCRIHDTMDGSLLVAIDSTDAISSAVFSPDGRYVLTATEPVREEGRSRVQQMSINPCLYDAQTGKFVRRFQGMTIREANDSCFSPNANRLLLCRGADAVIVDLSSTQQVVLRGDQDQLTDASFSGDGQRVLTLSEAGDIRIRDAETLVDTRPAVKLAGDPWSGKVAIVDTGRKLLVRDSRNLRMFPAAVVPGQPEVTYPARDEQRFCECPESGLICVYGAFAGKVSILSPKNFQVITEIPIEGRIESVVMRQSQRLVAVDVGQEVLLFDSETSQLTARLKGHTQKILDYALHAAAAKIFTGSNDGTLRMWNLFSGLQRQSFPRGFDEAEGFHTSFPPKYSPDGKQVAISSMEKHRTRFVKPDGTWLPDEFVGALADEDFRPDAALLTTAHSWRVHNVATGKLSYIRRCADRTQPDSGVLAAGARLLQRIVDSDAYLVDLETQSRTHLRLESEVIRDTDISLDQSVLLVSTAEGQCRLYDALSATVLWQVQIDSPVADAAISADKSRIAVLDVTGKITVWNHADGKTPVSHADAAEATSIQFLNDQHLIAWHHAVGGNVRCIDASNGSTTAEIASGEWTQVVTCKSKPLVIVNSGIGAKLWEPLEKKEVNFSDSMLRSPRFFSESIVALQAVPKTPEWQIVRWQLSDLKTPLAVIPVSGVPLRICVAEDESLFGVSFEEYRSLVQNADSGDTAYYSAAHNSPVSYAGFDQKGQTLVTVSADGIIGFTRDTGGIDYLRLANMGMAAKLSPDGTTLVACGQDGSASIVGVNERRVLEPVSLSSPGQVKQFDFDASGRLLVIAYADGGICFVDLQTREVKNFRRGGLRGVDLSANGRTLLLASTGPLVALDTSSGEEKVLFEKEAPNVLWAIFSPDNKSVALITADNELDVRSFDGSLLLHINSSGGRILHAAFHPDARHIVTSHPEKMLMWDLQTQSEVLRLNVTAGQVEKLSRGSEWKPFTPAGQLLVWDLSTATVRPGLPETQLFLRQLTKRECDQLRIHIPERESNPID